MKSLMLAIPTLILIQSANATVLAKCSLNNRPQEISGINLLMSNDSQLSSSAFLFFRTEPKIRLEGAYSIGSRMETWYYGNDLDRPAGKKSVKIVSTSVANAEFNADVELRFESESSNSRVSGYITVKRNGTTIAKNQSMMCDITDTLQE